MSKSNNATNTSLVYKATSAALAGVLSVSMVPILAIANEGPADATATNTESTGQNGLADEATADYITLALSTTYKDGTYTGTSTCTNGDEDDWGTNEYQVSVSVTVEGGAISKIELLDATYSSAGAENETYIDLAADGSKKKQGTITQIVSNNSTDGIDAVSGATYTSNAIIAAVNNALAQAGGTTTGTPSDDKNAEGDKADSSQNGAISVAIDDSEVKYVVYKSETPGAKSFEYAGQTYWYAPAAGASEISASTIYANVSVPANTFYQAMGMSAQGFDTVSTATQSKAARFIYADYTFNNSEGTDITGIYVPVSIDTQTYIQACILSELGVLSKTGAYASVAGAQSASTTMDGNTIYGTATADGITLTKPSVTSINGASATITTTSAWGDYEIDITDVTGGPIAGTSSTSGDKTSSGNEGTYSGNSTSEDKTTSYNKTSSDNNATSGSQTTTDGHATSGSQTTTDAKITSDSIVGMTITAADANGANAKTYSMGFLENIWFQVQELSWYVNGNQTMAKGGTPTNYKQFADIEGKTVTNVTYYTTNGVFDYNLASSNLFVKYQATDEILAALAGDSQVQFSSEGFSVALSSIPSGYSISTVKFGSGKRATTLTEGEDYTFNSALNASKLSLMAQGAQNTAAAGQLTITPAGAAKLGESTSMTLTFSSANNADITYSVDIDVPATLDTAALQELLSAVEGLTEADYTPESWAVLVSSLSAINSALETEGITQDELDALVGAGVQAKEGLVLAAKTDTPNNAEGVTGNVDAQETQSTTEDSAASSADTSNSTQNSNTTLAKTGDSATRTAAGATLFGALALSVASFISRRRMRVK